jgi:hypothetical protein
MHVRVVQTPPGEAPIEVREAWVGLVLPLLPGEIGPRQLMTQGVLTGPRNLLGYVFARLLRRFKMVYGFRVDGAGAVEVLARHNASAADWWHAHAPAHVQPGRGLVFHAEVCELVEIPAASPEAAPPDHANPGGPFTTDLN